MFPSLFSRYFFDESFCVLSFRFRENQGPLLTCCYQERYFLASGYFRHPGKKSPLLTLSEFKYSVSLHHLTITKRCYFCIRFANQKFICKKAPGLWEIRNGKHYKLLAVDNDDYF